MALLMVIFPSEIQQGTPRLVPSVVHRCIYLRYLYRNFFRSSAGISRTIEIIVTYIFNLIRYALTSLLLVPGLEWALQSIVDSSGARHLLSGGIMRWSGHRLGRLSAVPYSYNRKTRVFSIGFGLLIHSASLLGEYGFGAETLDKLEPTETLSSNASDVAAYISYCSEKNLR